MKNVNNIDVEQAMSVPQWTMYNDMRSGGWRKKTTTYLCLEQSTQSIRSTSAVLNIR